MGFGFSGGGGGARLTAAAALLDGAEYGGGAAGAVGGGGGGFFEKVDVGVREGDDREGLVEAVVFARPSAAPGREAIILAVKNCKA